jgi:hypothetical protein
MSETKMKIDRNALYTARWHLNTGKVVPAGAPREALLALMEPVIGSVAASAPVQVPAVISGGESPIVEYQHGDLPSVRDVVWMVGPTQRFPIVGAAFTAEEFERYVAGIPVASLSWSPVGVTIHHTAAPSLAQRPNGFQREHMMNLRSYYTSLGWDRGPHLFVDDRRIWVFSPITAKAIHAVSFNSKRFGIEILGDYDNEDPRTGRGLAACELAAKAGKTLIGRFGLPDGVNFHRDDPKTSKTCPGEKITKEWFLGLMAKP